MSGMSDSRSARLFFWFLWLGGIALGFFLLGQIILLTIVDDDFQKAIPYALGFIWQCGVQLASVKRYQHSNSSLEPLLIQLLGSLALVVIVGSILVLRV